ncbi:hypothetical protein BGZ54_001603 [Gamsiella multidivaricata]|nr:hypothetical protein BGZ54_001603 [Gamsiella multidivaricata]
MISPPSYTGPVAVLSEDIITLTYFRTTKASEWSLEGFLASTRLTELVFMSSLKDIARIKRLPSEIQIFAKRLEDYYDGVFQEEVIEVAKNNARKNVNRTLLSGKEHVLLQSYVDDTLERDKPAPVSPSRPSFQGPASVHDTYALCHHVLSTNFRVSCKSAFQSYVKSLSEIAKNVAIELEAAILRKRLLESQDTHRSKHLRMDLYNDPGPTQHEQFVA